MPKKLPKFPRRKHGRTGMDWAPYLDGNVWLFTAGELPYKSLAVAATGFRRKCESCGFKSKTMLSQSNGSLVVQAIGGKR